MFFLPRVKNKERFEGQQNINQQEHSHQNEKKKPQKSPTKCGLNT